MAIAHDNTTISAADPSSPLSHTVTGSDVTVVATFFMLDTVTVSVTSATYNGVSLTQRTRQENEYTLGSRFLTVEQWSLDGAATGANDLAWTFNQAPVSAIVCVSSYTGANNGVGANTIQNTGDSDNPSGTFTTGAATSLIIAAATIRGGDTNPFTPDGSATERADGNSGGNPNTDLGFTIVELSATGGSDTVGATGSASDPWAIVAFELQESGGAPPDPETVNKLLALLGVG